MDTKYLDIIKAPVITDKSSALAEEGKYVFKVAFDANKVEIKKAIEQIFKVKVVKIQTVNIVPKKKRVGRYSGMTNRGKKAIVTLAAGQTIELN